MLSMTEKFAAAADAELTPSDRGIAVTFLRSPVVQRGVV
jgi:hypothetical protein